MNNHYMGQAPFHLFEPGEEPRVTLGPDFPGAQTMETDPETLRQIAQAETIRAMQQAGTGFMLPPQSLWDRITAFMSSTPHAWMYLGIAAAVLLMGQSGGGRRRR